MKRVLFLIVTTLITLSLMFGCTSTKTATVNPESLNADEIRVYNHIKDLAKDWKAKNYEDALSHFSDDAIFTAGKNNAPTSKSEILKLCKETGDTWKISDIEIYNLSIDVDTAYVETLVMMYVGNNKPKYFKENYRLEKRKDAWLIVEEINP